jgi:hypothetical protein
MKQITLYVPESQEDCDDMESCNVFKPITHPQIKKIHRWAREANISINDFDKLNEILSTKSEIVFPEENI